MIQVNLLPDVKLEYIKAKQTKRTVVLSSLLISGTAVGILILLFLLVNVVQKKHLSDLNKDIATYTDQLKNTPDIDKILTIQNQLKSLPGLHDKKVVATRLFKYLEQVTPNKASIAKLDADFSSNKMTFTGSADSITTVNKFADTLKFTTYKKADGSTGKAFTSVVLTSFNHDSASETSYQLDVEFDPVIFDSASEVTLVVPKIISTRSETEKPTDLFQQSGQGGQ